MKPLIKKSGPITTSEIVLGKDVTTRSLRAVTGAGTVPQVFIGGKLIGSADELEAYLKKLDGQAAA